jgi:predicted benzoate:H+ symporter BenE
MKYAKLAGRLAGAAVVVSALCASAVVRLFISDPIEITRALADGAAEALVRELARAVGDMLRVALRWL